MLNKKVQYSLSTICSLIYFCSLLISATMRGMIVSFIWYFTIFLCVFINFLITDPKKILSEIPLLFIIIITGFLNSYFIGNISFRNQILLICYLFISNILTNSNCDEKVFLFCIIINEIVVVQRLLLGIDLEHFYLNSSCNYISVYLLYPCVIYYCFLEYKKKKLPFFPVFSVWVLSLFARGRGGIFSTTIFFILLIPNIFNYAGKKKIVFLSFSIILISIIACNITTVIRIFNSVSIFDYMREHGLKSSRIMYWNDYFSEMTKSWKYVIFGTDDRKTLIGIEKNGNPHNSFLSIHKNNGLFMLVAILSLLARSCKICIKNKKPVFIKCMFALLLRSFTDELFWPTYGTPVLFFIIYFPLMYIDSKRNIMRKFPANFSVVLQKET